MTLTKVKTITSHAGHFRFLAECEGGPDGADFIVIGAIPRQPDVPSPFAYAPHWAVYRWNGQPVVIREVSHKRYVVYRVDGPILPVEVLG